MKEYIVYFIPRNYEYLTKTTKIEYQGKNLKTAYLASIINELVLKYYFTGDVKFNLWSELLRKKYGEFYTLYIKYLQETGLISMVSNYFVSKKAKTFKLNLEDFDIIRVKFKDKILLKKYGKEYLIRNFTSLNKSPIDEDIKEMLINDLYSVKIDYHNSYKYINDLWMEKKIEFDKYVKNISSIESINDGHLFFKFDEYGRMHTNFTILKKRIRQYYLSIDDQELDEIDVKNSQPFFFAVFLKNQLGVEKFNKEMLKYLEVVKNGLLYDEFLDKFPDDFKSRDDAKMMVYKVLFGKNYDNNQWCKIFRQLYPSIYEYIKDFKITKKDYKALSHELQLLESEFIFNRVVYNIKKNFPKIKLFTIHDSIIYPIKYKEEVRLIWNEEMKKII